MAVLPGILNNSVTRAIAGGGLQAIGALTGNQDATAIGHNITDPGVTIAGAVVPGGQYDANRIVGKGVINGKTYNIGPGGNPIGASLGDVATTSSSITPTTTQTNNTATTQTGPSQAQLDQASIDAYNQAIGNTQTGIDRLAPQLQSGYGAIDTSFKNALNQLLLGRNTAQQGYDTSKQATANDFVTAKNTLGSNSGNTLNGLLRLLGSRGAGGSSAYNVSARDAVARDATLQRNGITNQFGQNNQALDQNWGNYLQGYNNQVNSATSQKDQQRQSLEQNINTNKASLLQSIAQLTAQRDQVTGGSGVANSQPYLDSANALLNQNADYTTSPINYQTQAYQAPSLASYTTTPTTPTYANSTSNNDYFSPYLQSLLGKKQTVAGA